MGWGSVFEILKDDPKRKRWVWDKNLAKLVTNPPEPPRFKFKVGTHVEVRWSLRGYDYDYTPGTYYPGKIIKQNIGGEDDGTYFVQLDDGTTLENKKEWDIRRDIFAEDEFSEYSRVSPLEVAVIKGHQRIVKYLLENGAKRELLPPDALELLEGKAGVAKMTPNPLKAFQPRLKF